MYQKRSGGVWSGVYHLVILIFFIQPNLTYANETDQFLFFFEGEMVDVGDFLSASHYEVLNDLVVSINKKIQKVKAQPDSAARRSRLRSLHAPMTLANFARSRFGQGFLDPIVTENVLRTKRAERVYHNQLTIYKTRKWIFQWSHFPLDPRQIPFTIPSSTIRVNNVYFGTDKIGHFHDLGHIYFRDYSSLVKRGVSKEEAIYRVIQAYSVGLISESALVGRLSTGVVSNADLASNYIGFKFYKNFTEPVMLKGQMQPPLLVRHGDYWSLNLHVRRDSGFFNVFVSDHFNEALNPCLYDWTIRSGVGKKIRQHADKIVAFYVDKNGKPQSREYFENLEKDLRTYYGEDYGYLQLTDDSPTIAHSCFGQ